MLTLKGNELLLYLNNASREGPYRHLTLNVRVTTSNSIDAKFEGEAGLRL